MAAPAAMPTTRRAGSKPFLIEGLNDETRRMGTAGIAGQRYSEFQAGVQLANRTGALNEIEYSEFVQQGAGLRRRHQRRSPTFPTCSTRWRGPASSTSSRASTTRSSRFTLRARAAAWSVGYVQQNARRLGFVAGAVPGRLVLPAADDGAPPVLALSFDTQAALADEPDQSPRCAT